MNPLSRLADLVLEASVVGAHTRIGFATRSRLEHWQPPTGAADLSGQKFVVTGATSGIGRSVATALARAGASIRSASRSSERAHEATMELRSASDNDDIEVDVVDLSRPAQAFTWGCGLGDEPIAGVVHAAGAYFGAHTVTPDGREANAAIYLLGPHALTAALGPALVSKRDAQVITVSSSGAYATGLNIERLEPGPEHYRPLSAYARAKRAQIVLTHAWHEHFNGTVSCYAMTPGWCDTDLVKEGLPRFRSFFRPILRTPDQGADTAIWLASHPGRESDRLWRDRRTRLEHRLPWTLVGEDKPDELWQWCSERSGYQFPTRDV